MRSAVTLLSCLMLIAASPSASPLTLRDALTVALSNEASAQAAIAASQQSAARTIALPTLNANLSYDVAPQPSGPDQTTATQQLILDFGSPSGRRGQALSARANANTAAAAFGQSHLAIVNGVLDAFFSVATDQAQLQSADEEVSLAQRTRSAAQQRHRVGVAPLVDVQRATAALATAQANQAAARAALDGDLQSLEAITGATATAVSLPAPKPLLAVTTVTSLAIAEPAVLEARANELSARASVLLARGQTEPAFSLSGGASQVTQGVERSSNPTAGAQLNFPFASGTGRATIAAANAQQISASAAYDAALRNAVRSALALRAQAAAAQARIAPLAVAFQQAQRVADSSLAGYRMGAVSSADLITSLSQLAAARSALAVATVNVSKTLAVLNAALGVSQ